MRTQIALEAEQHALVKRKAAELDISMAEYIRRLVERDLRRAGSGADISDIFGIGDSGGSNIAVDRKEATAEAISFDRDYLIYRFGRDRRQAFTVHA